MLGSGRINASFRATQIVPSAHSMKMIYQLILTPLIRKPQSKAEIMEVDNSYTINENTDLKLLYDYIITTACSKTCSKTERVIDVRWSSTRPLISKLSHEAFVQWQLAKAIPKNKFKGAR